MITVKTLLEKIDSICPFSWQADFDNSGLQIGNKRNRVKRVLLSLDLTDYVIEEAKAKSCDTIITHHPIFFHGIKQVEVNTGKGKLIAALLAEDITHIAVHTNLDKVSFGVNTVLGEKLNLTNQRIWEDEGGYGFGVIGELPEAISFGDYVKQVKDALNLPALRYCGDVNKMVATVAAMSGSGASDLDGAADLGVDVFVSGDFRHHDGQSGYEQGICLIDGTHFGTEVIVLPALKEELEKVCSDVEFIISSETKDYWDCM